MSSPEIDNYEQRVKDDGYWANTASFAYKDLKTKWMGEATLGFAHPDDVYDSEGLLLNFVSQNRFDWNFYMETPRFKDAYAGKLRDGFEAPVVAWIEEMQKGAANLVFVGSNATGKTHSAVAACRFMSLHGILRGSDNLYMPTCRTLDCADAHNVLDGWSKDQNAASNVDKYKNVPLLLMDDVGAVATSSQSAVSNITSIIGHRYNNNLPIVATSNEDVDALVKLYGSAVIRRIFTPPAKIHYS